MLKLAIDTGHAVVKPTVSNAIPIDDGHARFVQSSFDNFKIYSALHSTEQQAFKDAIVNYTQQFDTIKRTGMSLLFSGAPGTGKTHMLYAVASNLKQRGFTCVTTTATDIYRITSIARHSCSAQELFQLNQFDTCDLLCVDFWQSSNDADFNNAVLDVLDSRVKNRKPFIAEVPLAFDAFLTALPDQGSKISRLLDSGRLVRYECAWESFRG